MLPFTNLAAVALAALALPTMQTATRPAPSVEQGLFVLVDAHSYRHCHNIHTRVYCHKRDRLPMNWPPLSDTPHQGGWVVRSALDCPVTVIRRSFRSKVTLTCPVAPSNRK